MEQLISIIVPVYNVEKYLDRCITSLVEQTYKNIEIILVNDGSTDGSLEILKRWKNKDSRIIIIDKKNGGLSDARNAGMNIANGDFYCFVDSDDYINRNMIEYLYNLCVKNNVKMAGCDYTDFTDSVVVKDAFNEKNAIVEKTSFTEYIKKYIGNEKVKMVTAWGKLYARELFEDVCYPVGRIHEDEFTTYKLAYKAKTQVFSNVPYYYYYHREGSIMSNRNAKSYYDTLLAIYERDKFFDKENVYIDGWDEWLMSSTFVPCLECVIEKYNASSAMHMYRSLFKKYGLNSVLSIKQIMLFTFYRTTGILFKLKRFIKQKP